MDDPLPRDFEGLLAFGDAARHDPSVPTPEAVLGHPFGARITRHADQVRYLQALATASDRAVFQVYGHSIEGRELVHLVVGSPANLARLEAIQAALAQLADPAAPLPDLADLPTVTWIIANVHGGEHSSGEAALALAYHLLAAKDAATARILAESIVVIDPLQNPDGRDRSVNAYYSLHGLVANPDPNSAEHAPPWPGPRGSHYGFDLNRDWCLLTHPETRHRVAALLRWRPQTVADLHEMGSSVPYYFAPPAEPIEANVAESLRGWWEVFGRANAAAFDARGWDYFVQETFDSFYPGYGEAWPLYHGAVGMTYEQASPRTVGVKRADEQVLTLAEAAAHHLVAAYATCLCAAEHRRALLESYRAFFAETVAAGEAGPRRALLIDAGVRRGDAAELAANLRGQGVRVDIAAGPFELDAEPHGGGPAQRRTLPAGSLIIPLAQPAARLVRALCDAESPLPEAYVAEERDRWKHRAPSNLYDITAWSMPHRYGLEAYWSATVPAPPSPPPAAGPAGDTMAYLLPAGLNGSYRLLCRLLASGGWKPRVAGRAMTIGGRELGRGTVIVRARDHAGDYGLHLQALADDVGAEIVPVASAWAEAGINIGSYEVSTVKPPKVAVLTRPPVASLAAGWVSYLLEHVYELPYTPLDALDVTPKVLHDYNVLVMPDASDWKRAFGADGELLKSWVTAGGTLVALGHTASEYLAGQGDRFTTATVLQDLRQAGAEPKPADDKPAPLAAEHQPQNMPGFTAWVELDPYSYLTYGCERRMRVRYAGSKLFTPTLGGHTIARFAAAGEVIAAGLVPEKMAAVLRGHAWLWQELHGAGQVVCFATAPTFRASWPILDRLWLNAVLFGPSRRRE